jgi:hypothetical protein
MKTENAAWRKGSSKGHLLVSPEVMRSVYGSLSVKSRGAGGFAPRIALDNVHGVCRSFNLSIGPAYFPETPPFSLSLSAFRSLSVRLSRSERSETQSTSRRIVSHVICPSFSSFSFLFSPPRIEIYFNNLQSQLGQNSRLTGTKFTSNWDKIHVYLGQNSRQRYGTKLDSVSHLCDGRKKRLETVVAQRFRPNRKPT